jgi:hypothetical protein
MSELEPTTRALLAASRNADEPSSEAISRVERSLMLKIAAGASASIGIGAATAKAAGASLGVKLAGGALLVGVVAGAGVMLTRREPAPAIGSTPGAGWVASAATPAARPTAAVTPAPEPEALAPRSAADGEPQPAERAAARRDNTKPESPALKLKAEAALIGEAQRALGAGRAAEALERLTQYDQRFAGGALRSEADATRVFALCQSGRLREGEAAKQAFLRRYPSSPAAPRVRSACSTSK